MDPEKIVKSYEEFCHLREELDMRESEAQTAIEDMKWLKENPITMSSEEYQRLKVRMVKLGDLKKLVVT